MTEHYKQQSKRNAFADYAFAVFLGVLFAYLLFIYLQGFIMLGIYLGQNVKTSKHVNATIYMVKKIDSENDRCYIIPVDNSYCGEWYSTGALIGM